MLSARRAGPLSSCSSTSNGFRVPAARYPVPMRMFSSGNGGNGGRPRVPGVGAAGGDGAGSSKGSSGGGLWQAYVNFLEAQPVLSRCITCGVLNGIGDLFSQLVVEQQKLDAKRLATFTALGLVFVGPILTAWYSLLPKLVTASGTTGVVLSVAVDQLLFAPPFIASFMAVLTTIEGHPERIGAKLRQDLPDAIKVNWGLWVPAQIINFKFVPPNLRVLAVNITALAWNVYMSWQSHKAVVVEAPTPAAAVAAAVEMGKGRRK